MKVIKVNEKAPDFTLKNESGIEVSLHDFLKNAPVLLAFYPGDFTPVCTMQLCEYRDSYKDYLDLGIQLVGISGDSIESHKKFIDQRKFKFSLLSDPDHKIAKKFGMKDLFGMSKRGLVLVDTSGIVRSVTVEVVSLFYRKHQKVLDDIKKVLTKA